MELWGFEIKRKSDESSKENETVRSFTEKENEDGSLSIASALGVGQGTFIDLEGSIKTEAELINKYRSMLLQPEVQHAVDDIINEMIVSQKSEHIVELDMGNLDYSDNVKKKIQEEFEIILKLLDFQNQAYDIAMRWYVDGRLNYHLIIDEANTTDGIKELRYIDPRKIRKIREYEEKRVGEGPNAIQVKKLRKEYYIYNESGFGSSHKSSQKNYTNSYAKGLKIAKDSIIHCNSGVMNEDNTAILSQLHKAYKPLNQLRIMEDASVIYRITRAPERRIFYIDVGNLPKMKAEQYLRDMMTKHKNRVVYDAATGEMRDDRNFMTMTDDFWLPRREGGRGTEITTLPAGQNLGEMEDIKYFQNKLYKSLNVPVTRLESDAMFNLGRSSEVSRDEIKFSKFIQRLRLRFSILFDELLQRQLTLKNIITPEDWDEIRESVYYKFQEDNHFEEMKKAEILRERLSLLSDAEIHSGTYFSKEWIRKNVLQMSDDKIEEMQKQIDKEKAEAPDEEEDNSVGGGFSL